MRNTETWPRSNRIWVRNSNGASRGEQIALTPNLPRPAPAGLSLPRRKVCTKSPSTGPFLCSEDERKLAWITLHVSRFITGLSAMPSSRLNKALAAIDAANEGDPRRVAFEGAERGAEEVYSRRMSRTLERLYPEASEHLRIAARGQHIERWTHPRSGYPRTRQGYLRWRSALLRYHSGRVGQIMAESGYSTADVARVESLVLKQRLKYDAEVQALEDVVCVVFLEDYFTDFAGQHDDAKVIDILRKTWAKMSPHGREAALKLDLPAASQRLVEAALA